MFLSLNYCSFSCSLNYFFWRINYPTIRERVTVFCMLKTWRLFNHCQRLPLFLFSVLWYWIALLWTNLDLMPKKWLRSCHKMKVNGHNSTISIFFLSATQNIWQNKWFFLSGFSSCNGQVFLFLTLVDRHALVLFVGGNCCFDFQIFHFSLKTFFFISSCQKKLCFIYFLRLIGEIYCMNWAIIGKEEEFSFWS